MKLIMLHKLQVKKKHAVDETTKLFASRRLEAVVAYGCNPPVNTVFAAAKTRVRFLPMVSFFLLFLFFNCKTTIHEDPGSIPCSGELFGF